MVGWIVAAFLLIVVCAAGMVAKKLTDEVANYEEFFEGLYDKLKPVADSTNDILTSDIYSGEPVVMDFVEQLGDLDFYLREVNPDFALGTEETLQLYPDLQNPQEKEDG